MGARASPMDVDDIRREVAEQVAGEPVDVYERDGLFFATVQPETSTDAAARAFYRIHVLGPDAAATRIRLSYLGRVAGRPDQE